MTLALVSTYCVPDSGDRTGPLPGTHWQSGMWVRPALRKGVMWREARTDEEEGTVMWKMNTFPVLYRHGTLRSALGL